MIVEFMQNFSDRDYLYKNTSTLFSANCTLLEPCDILNPHFILEYQSVLTSCNYCYVPEFGRYYFTTIEFQNGNRARITCNVDPLQSWQNQISNIYANVSLSQNQIRAYIPDDRIAIENANDLEIIEFPFPLGNSDFSGVHYLMSVIGGISSPGGT